MNRFGFLILSVFVFLFIFIGTPQIDLAGVETGSIYQSLAVHKAEAEEPVESRGLVPCGGTNQDPCQACHVVSLVNEVVAWLVGILGVIATIVIVYGGFKLVTSGGNVSVKEGAKSMITNIIIGYIIVLSAWLVIDYGAKVLINEGVFGVWNEIACVTQTKATSFSMAKLNGYGLENYCDPGPNGDLVLCTNQITNCTDDGGKPTTITDDPNKYLVRCDYPSVGGGGGSCEVMSSGPCSVNNLQSIFGDRAEQASMICNMESGGAPVMSGSDLCCGPGGNCSGAPSFSGGYFQINFLAHSDLIPGCNLSSFFTKNGSTAQGNCVRRNKNGICTGWSCSIVRNSAYEACTRGAMDHNLNLSIAKRLFDSRGFDPWRNSRNKCSVPN